MQATPIEREWMLLRIQEIWLCDLWLKFAGTWVHAGYHLTTAIAGPSLLTLPYAFTFLGWLPGLITLTIGGSVSSYAYYLLSTVLEHCAAEGNRYYRFRELSDHVIGEYTRNTIMYFSKRLWVNGCSYPQLYSCLFQAIFAVQSKP